MAEADVAIADGVALRICRELRGEHRGKLLSWRAWQCKVCARLRAPERRSFANKPGNRGCRQVNERFEAQYAPYVPRGPYRGGGRGL